MHFSSIRGEGHKKLQEGQEVEFTLREGQMGPQALDVVALSRRVSESRGLRGRGIVRCASRFRALADLRGAG